MANLREGKEFIAFIIDSGQNTDDGLSMLCTQDTIKILKTDSDQSEILFMAELIYIWI